VRRAPARVRRAGPVLVGLLVAVLAACGTEPTLNGIVRSEPLDVSGVTLADVTRAESRGGGLVTAEGRLSMRAAEGRLLVVYFGFLNCPDVCPTTLADLRSALGRLTEAERDRVDLAFVTVDPERDGPDELAAYLRHFAPRHHALRDDEAELSAALDAFLASAEVRVDSDGDVEVAHTAVLYAVDAAGLVVLEWPFGTSPAALADDLRVLLARSGAQG